MPDRALALVTLVALVALAGLAPAQQLLVPVEQTRVVGGSAEATDGGTGAHAEDVARDEAADLGPFVAAETASVTIPGVILDAGGTQTSAIEDAAIVATGAAFANGQFNLPGTSGFAQCVSRCVVVFDVAQQVSYTLQGSASAGNNGSTYVRLRVAGGATLFTSNTIQAFETISDAGVLAPGRYQLEIAALGGGGGAFPDVPIWADADYDLAFALAPAEPGVAACFGTACPCGNDDPTAGCASSTGQGGRLAGSGSASVGADDLVLAASGLPAGQSALVYTGDALGSAPFFDGRQCALGTTFRFLDSIGTTTPGGSFAYGPGIAAAAGGLLTAGSTWHFQVWHRDVPGTPCGTGANLTSAYSVTFLP